MLRPAFPHAPRQLSPSLIGAGALVLLAVAGPAAAKDLSTDPTSLPKAAYRLDPTHTSVIMRVSHMGFSHFTLRFDKVSGGLDYDPEERTHPRLKIEIDARTVDTGDKGLDEELAGRHFFDTAKFPTITFTATDLVEKGDGTGELNGELSFHGVTKPVTLEVAFNGGGGDVIGRTTMGFSAKASLKRSDYGVSAYPGLVGDEVDVAIETELKKDSLLTRLIP